MIISFLIAFICIWNFETKVKAGSSKKIKAVKLKDVGFELNEGFMMIETFAAEKTHVNTHFFAPYKTCELLEACVKTKVYKDHDNFKVELYSAKPAL